MKKLWPLLLASTLGFIILCSLGTWQVFRLAEKTRLIAQLEARIAAQPITLAAALERQAKGEALEYVKIMARGRFEATPALAKIGSYKSQPGWNIVAPFISEDGIFVLVDVGAAPEKQVLPRNEDTLNGIIRLHRQGRGFFDNHNNAEQNVWYWWDLPEMLASANPPAAAKTAPFIVQRLPEIADKSPPFAEMPKIELSNNHLGYAITWFGLAAALVVVAGVFARSLVLDQTKREG